MMASAQEAVLHLPDELVALSHGFSLDIGSSLKLFNVFANPLCCSVSTKNHVSARQTHQL